MNSSAAASRPIPVMEIFGPTVQGEGMVIGRKTMFVRTAGCDYRCSWCDSSFTWDGSGKDDIELLSPQQIWEELYQLGGSGFDHVTLSGGNPMLLPQLGELVDLLGSRNIRTAVETQGSIWQDWALRTNEVTLSPKPPSSGMTTDMGQLNNWITRLSARLPDEQTKDKQAGSSPSFCLKIVVFDEMDLDYAAEMHKQYPHVPLVVQTGNPHVTGGTPMEAAARLLPAYERLINWVMERPDLANVRVLPQLHTLVWGNKRGV